MAESVPICSRDRKSRPLTSYESIRESDGSELEGHGALDSLDILRLGPAHQRTDAAEVSGWSFCMIYYIVLAAEAARGVMFPTLWLNIQSVHGNKFAQGLAVAAFSFGRVITSPIFGHYSDAYGHRAVLTVSNCILLTGCLYYATARSVHGLIIAQFIIGSGAGSLSVARSYVAEHTTIEKRTTSLAHLTALQYGGFTVTPVIGSMLAYVGYHHKMQIAGNVLVVNEMTLPALFVGLLACVALVIVRRYLPEDHQHERKVVADQEEEQLMEEMKEGLSESAVFDNHGKAHAFSMQDKILLAACLLNVATKGSMGVFEALGTMFVSSHFHWESAKVGLVYSLFGVVGVFLQLAFGYLLMCVAEVELMAIGISVMALACIVLALPYSVLTESHFYLALALMYSIGYPLGHTVLIGLFSKLIKKGPQGALLGWFGSAGSVARIAFPLLAGLLAEYFDEFAIFSVMTALLILSVAFVVVYRRTIYELSL